MKYVTITNGMTNVMFTIQWIGQSGKFHGNIAGNHVYFLLSLNIPSGNKHIPPFFVPGFSSKPHFFKNRRVNMVNYWENGDWWLMAASMNTCG